MVSKAAQTDGLLIVGPGGNGKNKDRKLTTTQLGEFADSQDTMGFKGGSPDRGSTSRSPSRQQQV